MVADDYPTVIELWRRTDGIGLNESDSLDAIVAYLERNPGMSAVCQSDTGEIVGAVLCGHDGRRGYLHHLAVVPGLRRRGVANRLLTWCFDRLHDAAIPKCNVFLFNDNHDGASFWQHVGWQHRSDLVVVQKTIRRER